jgi:hypothetical protein
MCGIVGLITKKYNGFFGKDLEIFQAMLINDTQRGEDSTGSFLVNKDGSSDSIKIASHPFHLFITDEWNKYKNKAIQQGRILVGHNRKATQGAINSANAHPFTEGKIVLVHNGTLRNYQKFKSGKVVDSHAIAYALNENPVEEVISQIEGAFALVWYNIEEEKLHMIRNSERPLSLIKTRDTIAFASESWMAVGQFLREKEKIEENVMIPEGVLHTFDIKGECTTKKLELFKYVYESGSYGAANNNWKNIYDTEYEEYPTNSAAPDPLVTIVKPFQEYKEGDTVQIQIRRIVQEHNAGKSALRFKASGKIVELNKTEIDFVGWLPDEYKPQEGADYIDNPTIAKISHLVNSNCGTSAWVKDIEIDDVTTTYNGELGSWTYKQVIDKECCSKCSSLLEFEDAVFTSINLKDKGHRIHCADCVEKSLPSGEKQDAFTKRRIAALQAREPVGQKASPSTGTVIQLSHSPVVH